MCDIREKILSKLRKEVWYTEERGVKSRMQESKMKF